jgi:hypothetical protein
MTGETIVKAPVAVDDRLYVATELGGMYCFEAQTGKRIWLAPGAIQFVSASKSRVYAVDSFGRMLILNAANGARLGVVGTENVPIKLVNEDTDRIYLADGHGLIQCLHEVDQAAPLVHLAHHQQVTEVEEKPTAEAKKAAEAKPVKKEPAAPKEKAVSEEPARDRPAAKEPRAPKEPRTPKAARSRAAKAADKAKQPIAIPSFNQ